MTYGRRTNAAVLRLQGVDHSNHPRLIQEWARDITKSIDGGLPAGDGTDAPGAQVFGAGSAGEPTDGWAPISHVHPMASATPASLGSSNTEGTSNVPSRADHSHKRAVEVQHGGAAVGIERVLNLIDGTNVTWTTADDAGNDRIDVTPAVTGLALASEQYLVLAASGSLSAERVLTPDDSTIMGTDGGAGAAYTLAAKNTKRGTTTLTNATHTQVFEVAVASGAYACGRVLVTVQITDATDFEAAAELVTYAAVNKGGTLTVTAGAAASSSRAQSTGAGMAIVYSPITGTNTIIFRVRATSGLGAPTTLTCRWEVHDETGNTITGL